MEALVRARRQVWLVVSAHGERLLEAEAGIANVAALREHVSRVVGGGKAAGGGSAGCPAWDAVVRVFDDGDRGAAPASGSARTAGMIICPCSMGTVAAIAHGTSRSLIERAADVTLKERRPLIVVPRETPLSEIHLENLLRLTRAGATVLPAAPGFYNRPEGVAALVDFVVARVLDHAAVEHDLGRRWDPSAPPNER
ncbi:MAG: UbiX family flavin prenyltransferase [Gemmatimonadaceae bacterium]